MPWRERKGDGKKRLLWYFHGHVPGIFSNTTNQDHSFSGGAGSLGRAQRTWKSPPSAQLQVPPPVGAHPAEHAVQKMLVLLLYQDDFCVIMYQDKKTWVFWSVYLMSVCVWDEPGKKGLGWEVVFSPSVMSRGRERVAGSAAGQGQPTTICYWQAKGSSPPRNYSKCRFTLSCARLNPEIPTPIRLSVHWPCIFFS